MIKQFKYNKSDNIVEVVLFDGSPESVRSVFKLLERTKGINNTEDGLLIGSSFVGSETRQIIQDTYIIKWLGCYKTMGKERFEIAYTELPYEEWEFEDGMGDKNKLEYREVHAIRMSKLLDIYGYDVIKR